MKNCSSYTCAVTQRQCTATLFRAKCIPHFSVLLCKTGSQQVCVRAAIPMEICFSIQVCSDPTPRHKALHMILLYKGSPRNGDSCGKGSSIILVQQNWTYLYHALFTCNSKIPTVGAHSISCCNMLAPRTAASIYWMTVRGQYKLQKAFHAFTRDRLLTVV